MKKFSFKNLRINSDIGKLIFSSLSGILSMLLLCFLGAFIFYIGDLDFDSAFIFSIAVYVISSFICGYTAGRKFKEKGMFAGLAGGFLMFIFCLIISLFNDIHFSLDMLYKLGICLTSGAIGGIIGVNKRNRKKIKPKKAN